jgi:hypothetical protein
MVYKRFPIQLPDDMIDKATSSKTKVARYLDRNLKFVNALIDKGILNYYASSTKQSGIQNSELVDFLYSLKLARDQYNKNNEQTYFAKEQWLWLEENYSDSKQLLGRDEIFERIII